MKFIKKFSSVFFLLTTMFIFQNEIYSVVENAQYPSILTNNQGQYVYDLWTKNDSLNDIIQIARSSNYATNWNAPINLSAAGQNAKNPSFTMDYNEQNIYVIWARSNGTNDIIQFSRSLDFAQNFSTPQDLSAIGQTAKNPQIITTLIGDKVYTIWARSNGNDIIQFSKSLDYGGTFSTRIDLSDVGQTSKTPQIATNVDGMYICAIWVRSDGTNDIIQFKNSTDYGANWNTTIDLSDAGENAKDPRILTTGSFIYTVWSRFNSSLDSLQVGGIDIVQFRRSIDGGQTFTEVIDLSPPTFSANLPKIATSRDGKYVYITWFISNGKYTDVHVVSSNDYGEVFTGPYVLNRYGQNCQNTDIATNGDGKNVYIVWTRSNGYNDIVQLGKSLDYGATWTTFGIDLSQIGQSAKNPKVSTNQLGNEVYVTWTRFDGTKDVIQEAHSNDYGASFSTPVTISN